MKIALCSKGKFSLEIGSTKNRIELADALQKVGWNAYLIDRKVLGMDLSKKYESSEYNTILKDYLIEHAAGFDVVLYEYDTLPFDRSLFNKQTLFVARPAILAYHLLTARFKLDIKTKLISALQRARALLSGTNKKADDYYKQIDYCLSQADLIQVQNRKDKELLIKKNIAADKIVVVPNGISAERMNQFIRKQKIMSPDYTIACVGTFDYRKGALDFPKLFKSVKKEFPGSKLKLLGTSGLFKTQSEVLRFFPKKYHASIEVIPKFNAADLPGLLKDCQLGIFPSYLESFGFGALEMMCAGLPVVAYDAPGPSDFILEDLLVPTGNTNLFTQKVISLLKNPDLLEKRSKEAQQRVRDNYCWDDIAVMASDNYKNHLLKLRASHVDNPMSEIL